jgi:hypothetical protein
MLPKDMDQASRMLNLRIKIDVWSQGVRESVREDARNKLRDMYCEAPARRFWLYLKHIRFMLLKGVRPERDLGLWLESDTMFDGAEDAIVNGKWP